MASPPDNPRSPWDKTRIASLAISFCWALNLIVLIWLAIWVYGDPLFDDTLHWFLSDWKIANSGISTGAISSRSDEVVSEKVRLQLLLGFGVVSMLGIAIGLLLGPARFRRLSAWLGMITLTSAWIALLLSYDSLAWSGKQARVRAAIDGFQPIVDDLHKDWPEFDGRRAGIGPFVAYPSQRPTLLMRLNRPAPDDPIWFKLVERSEAGGLRFELGGRERGAWLEWHPDNEVPDSFIGGLGDQYLLTRSSDLGHGWYLTEYQSIIAKGRVR